MISRSWWRKRRRAQARRPSATGTVIVHTHEFINCFIGQLALSMTVGLAALIAQRRLFPQFPIALSAPLRPWTQISHQFRRKIFIGGLSWLTSEGTCFDRFPSPSGNFFPHLFSWHPLFFEFPSCLDGDYVAFVLFIVFLFWKSELSPNFRNPFRVAEFSIRANLDWNAWFLPDHASSSA